MGGALVEREIVFAPLFSLPEFIKMGGIECDIWRDCPFRDGKRDDE